ncbi:Nif3-like dinuclear metal center hexameric protein [Ancylomarina longa]|uniref:GTP cyclohydrolase 1 type 2 homolog n=1 Tax=Ancylomarina longa TaxID=2487017 RepID=A0A434AFX0_9BACT|nr:Nif3-like dinuclear metal center hexameric protein [Ancylomarina longa]RUT73269.1 Nif3-like dinuclear metal center hexameric protein [Ancylomarina longa]
MKVQDIVSSIEQMAPLSYQESYDNSGLIVGDSNLKVSGVLICLDVTEAVVEEAIQKGDNLIISHHPILFKGIKSLTGKSYVERTLILAIQHKIAIYASHTNMDAVQGGVSDRICDLIGLKDTRVLVPVQGDLKKLVSFVPEDYAEKVRNAIFQAGAGSIGNYDSCSFNAKGIGTFRGGENANPFVGEKDKLHEESEVRIETIFSGYRTRKVIDALLKSHPYEEVAYDIYPIENENPLVGHGRIGVLEESEDAMIFLNRIKKIFNVGCIRYTNIVNEKISKIAVCGGSGSFLLAQAIKEEADVFITGDFKYHEFFNAEEKLMIADIGHYESEQFTRDIFYELVTKKFPNFAVHISEINSNPINYL